MPKRKNLVINPEVDSIELSKAGQTTISYNTAKGYWRIRCYYYSMARANGVRMEANYYLTENAAKSEEELFRFAVHTDRAKFWKNYNPNDLARNDCYKQKRCSTFASFCC